ncbi:major allergen Pru ar 1-like [Euphorbia lathyris]|uniref:major allergen Pru ar 1-like n=1 Tax=Euphorbia lathyris TaxID=212925 RepID=UPI003313D0F1
MGILNFETEIVCKHPPSTMFKTLIFNFTELVTKAIPQVYKSLEVLGDGGVGTIRKVHFGEGILLKYMEERVDSIDEENLTYSSTILEGDEKGIEKIVNDFKFEESPDGGTIIKKQNRYYTVGDYKLDEEEINKVKQTSLGLFIILEDYMLANPDICLN